MSTDIADFISRIEGDPRLEIYTSNGITIFLKDEDGTGLKFRLRDSDISDLIQAITTAKFVSDPHPDNQYKKFEDQYDEFYKRKNNDKCFPEHTTLEEFDKEKEQWKKQRENEEEFYKRISQGKQGDVIPVSSMEHKYNDQDKLMDMHIRLCDQAIKLMKKKNSDYSYGDDPYNNFRGSDMFGINPIIGILLRMQDKMMRIKTFALCNNLNVKEESVNDSIIDLINYAVLIAGYIEYEKEKQTNKE